MFSNAKEAVKYIKENDVEFVDVRFMDLPGVMQHFNVPAQSLDESFFTNGQMFDGSSIRGFQAIHESDMKLIPDVTTAFIDPFRVEKTLVVNFSIRDPFTNEPYSRDPRQIAARPRGFGLSGGNLGSRCAGFVTKPRIDNRADPLAFGYLVARANREARQCARDSGERLRLIARGNLAPNGFHVGDPGKPEDPGGVTVAVVAHQIPASPGGHHTPRFDGAHGVRLDHRGPVVELDRLARVDGREQDSQHLLGAAQSGGAGAGGDRHPVGAVDVDAGGAEFQQRALGGGDSLG